MEALHPVGSIPVQERAGDYYLAPILLEVAFVGA
jgi:hypothetical protein